MNGSIQKNIQKLLDNAVKEGHERGIQVAAYYHGELVVDAWAGIADAKTGRCVDGSTLFPVFSTSKGIASTVIHILAEKGKLDYDMKIGDIWPEFNKNGKENITLRNALTHTAGIPQLPEYIDIARITDWHLMCEEIEKLAPLWQPGERYYYHALTFGWIIGEVARRADGRPFSRLLQEEICKPLGITDMYLGIPDDACQRVAVLEGPESEPGLENPDGIMPIPRKIMPLHSFMNNKDVQRACIPAGNGIMTAKAIARHYAALIPGGVDGIQLLSEERLDIVRKPFKLTNGNTLPIGLGYLIGAESSILGTHPYVIGHTGHGGSLGFADLKYGLAVGLVKNLFSNNGAEANIVNELKAMFGIPAG